MLSWQNGQPFSEAYGDIYFSADAGLAEKRHVFLQGNALPARFAALTNAATFAIGETGFGSGLSFLAAWQLFEQTAPADCHLDFFSVEKCPLADQELATVLNLWPELTIFADELLRRWRRRVPGWNHWHFAGGRVRLTLVLDEVLPALTEFTGTVDAWFLDGFSPAKNPDMWNEAVLASIAQHSKSTTTLATYTCAGWVRRGLQHVGFAMEKTPGFARKHEMLRGQFTLANVTANLKVPRSVIVIGGGLAGCATASALARRGIAVTLIEQSDRLASAASGNPRGILHARFGAGMLPLHRFVLAAYGHALALLDDVLPVDDCYRAECGLLQLASSASETKRIAKLAAQDWSPHLLQAVSAAQASAFAGSPLACAGLWLPAGGWLVPAELCARLVAHPLIDVQFNRRVLALNKQSNGWCAVGEHFELAADALVVCCAQQAKRLLPFQDLPLQAVRGQISELPATAASAKLQTVVCAEGYCTPALAGRHLIGATTTFDDESDDIRERDHVANLAALAENLPNFYQALGDLTGSSLRGRAGIRCSVPGSMPMVGEIEENLYCSLAHGTRGLLSTGLAGEVIAAAMCGNLSPLPRSLLSELNPKRWRRQRQDKE